MTSDTTMKGVEVFGEEELVASIESGEGHYRACISIGSPRPLLRAPQPGEALHPLVRSAFPDLLRIGIYDLEQRPKGLPLGRLPGVAEARRVLQFYERTRARTGGWTIHCWAGVSRSTACALGLLYILRGDEARAADELRRIRPQAMPNLRFVRAFDQVLGSRLLEQAAKIHASRREELELESRAALDGTYAEMAPADA